MEWLGFAVGVFSRGARVARARRRAHGSRRAAAGTSPPGVVRGRRLWLPGEALIELEGGLGHRIGGGIVLGAGGPPTVAGRGRVRSAAVCERLCVRQTSTIGILSFATRALGTLRGVRHGFRRYGSLGGGRSPTVACLSAPSSLVSQSRHRGLEYCSAPARASRDGHWFFPGRPRTRVGVV